MARFGITMGDPCGIGPEIIIKALKVKPEYIDDSVVFGSAALAGYYAGLLGLRVPLKTIGKPEEAEKGHINILDPFPVSVDDIQIGRVSKLGGECAFRYVIAAIKAAMEKRIASVVTAPLNKEALQLAGHKYAGHTEIFSEFAGSGSSAMLLWSEKLKVIHISTHVSLKKACELVSRQRVSDVIRLADSTLRKLGYDEPRIAVAGLNPHAGENGLFGDEENREIIPSINECRDSGICVYGPAAPDTVFWKAAKGEFDIVVAQYHDQGHIPVKLLAFDSGVNITVGLDITRTSVDHGTAFDIAGKLLARENSLIEAIEIGRKL